MKGKFITFEGSEGCGKSTQSRLLYEYLKNKGLKVIYLREPGGTAVGEKIRKILLDNGNTVISAICEMFLYMAARAQLVSAVIKPALKKGKIVICDRFLDSTLAYQGYGLGADIKVIRYIGRIATENIQPDLTIFLDLPIKDGLKHRRLKEDRIESRSLRYHRRVRQGYLLLAAKEPRRIKIVKVSQDKDKTQAKIRALVEHYVF
ncbi:MAG: dTMP kinase [Candidatus Omnitrophica bacterium]|nr:dTMP kinase [Candidatus Omnitrophota bacterium]